MKDWQHGAGVAFGGVVARALIACGCLGLLGMAAVCGTIATVILTAQTPAQKAAAVAAARKASDTCSRLGATPYDGSGCSITYRSSDGTDHTYPVSFDGHGNVRPFKDYWGTEDAGWCSTSGPNRTPGIWHADSMICSES